MISIKIFEQKSKLAKDITWLLGFNARPVKASPELLDRLNEAPLPAIIHWKGNHWVVLYGQKRQKYIIADPASGIRYLTRRELVKGWGNGVMLLLQPDDVRFYEQPEDKVTGFGRYLKRVYPYRWLLVQVISINFAVGLLSLASPVMMQLLTDDVLVRGDTQLLATVAIGVIALNLIQSGVSIVQSFLIGHFGQRLQLGLIYEYGRQLFRLPLSYFEARRSGEVVSRIADINAINSLISQIVLGLPSQFFIALVSLALMLFYSWQLTLASVATFVLITLVNLLFLPALRQKTRKMIIQGTENQGFLVETFRGTQILKSTPATPQAWQEYQANYGRLANLGWETMKLGLYSGTITKVLSTFTSIGLLWLGSYLVINGTLSIGQLIAYHGMSANFLGFLGAVVGLIDEFITAQVVIQRLAEVIDATPEDENDFKKPWEAIAGDADINCTDLNFHHAGRVDLLADFSLKIPDGELGLVQAFTEGQVTDIAVKENQAVTQGDVIAIIDDSRLQNQKSQLQGNIQQGKAQLVQINAQITALNSQKVAESDRLNRIVASAESELERRQREYQDKQVITIAQVEEAKANVQSAKAALKAAQSKQNRYQTGAKQGAIAKDQLEEVKLAVEQQKQAVTAANAKLQQTITTLNPSPAEVAIATEQIATEQASGQATLANLNREQKALIQQRIEASKELESDRHELQQAEIDLTQTKITAPTNGIVFKLNLRNPSQTVQPGQEIAQIAPDNAPSVIKAAVSPQDIGKLETGQKVEMQVSACPYSDYGTLEGKVSQVSQDTIKPENNGAVTTSSPQASTATKTFYEVTIEPASVTLGEGKNKCSIQLGMEGRADIITREDTVLKFLLRKAKLMTNF